MKKKLLLLILLCSLSGYWIYAAAQVRGYILRKDATYADGYITNKQNYGFQVLFRPSVHGEDVAYGPGQIQRFGFGGVTYLTKQVMYNGKQEEMFLRLLESGELNLYMLHTAARRLFYLEHQGQITEVTEENLEEVYGAHFSYCGNFKERLQHIEQTRADLEKLTRMINKKNCFVLLTFKVGAVARPVHSFAVMNKESYSFYGHVPSLETGWVDAGVSVELPYLFVSGLKLGGEALYRYRKFEDTGTQPEGHDITLIQSALQLNLVPHYAFGSGRVRPFIEAGGIMVVDINSRSELIRRYYLTNRYGVRKIIMGKQKGFLPMSDLAFGYLGAAGVKYMFRNKLNYVSLSFSVNKIDHDNLRYDEMGLTIKVNL